MTFAETFGGTAGAQQVLAPRSSISIVLWNDRGKQVLRAALGGALMVVLKAAGAPLPAVCGGKGVCGTCKVSLMRGWIDKLPPPEKREQRLLSYLKAVAGERLSCQITITADLDGIEVRAPIELSQQEHKP